MKQVFRACVAGTGVWLALIATAFAQTPQSNIGLMAQSAFGNVTSQAFGVEAGYPVSPTLDVFLEGGRAFDAAPKSTGQAAQIIAGSLSRTEPSVAYSVSEPVDFFDAGLRYRMDLGYKLVPYVLGGGGIGMVKPQPTFTINSVDVTGDMAQYGIALGSDLSGTTTRAMIVLGGGAQYPLGQRLYADVEFRYNRVFVSGGSIPFSRAGIGFGVRF